VKKNIVITGGSGGIGLELVRHYLKKNNTVITTYKNSNNELVKLKKKYGKNIFFKNMDLGNVKDITKFLKMV